MTWTDPILKISSTSGFSNTLKLLLAEIKNKESITNSAFSKELLGHGLLSENGKLSVPIIHEQPGDPIFETTSEISQMIANVMIKTSQTPDFKKIIRTTDKAKALVIGYHEFMWEILSYLENENVLKSPFASNGNEQIKASDLHKLVYIIEKTQ
jgi:hypothetical protein